ncbi:MAG: hypothetical protein M3Y77_11065 [Actinomycetota bacterium]|nr:hypothetical protein [Actinomycetota bacterium]
MAVTFSTTADTPDAGTPLRPKTCNANTPLLASGRATASSPDRVSNNRVGATGRKVPATDGTPAV